MILVGILIVLVFCNLTLLIHKTEQIECVEAKEVQERAIQNFLPEINDINRKINNTLTKIKNEYKEKNTPHEQENKVEEPKEVYLGEFTATAYCIEDYPHICNNGDASVTATGEKPIPGKTVAVDPSVIPYGSQIKVVYGDQTMILRANDTGGAINSKKIDLVYATHKECLEWGKRKVKVWLILNN